MAQAVLRNQPLLTPDELAGRLGEFYRSLDEFNAGYFFESHETLEDLWMVTPWPERQLFQGVIQLAAAFVHYVRGEYPGIMKLLDASLDKLAAFAPERFGVDVDALVRETERARDAFAELGEARLAEFDETLAPRIRFEQAR